MIILQTKTKMKKKLIKRLEELAVENERLSNENSELRKELLKEVRNKVFNELDKDERPKTTSSYQELGSVPKEEEKESVTVSIKHNDTNTEWTYDILISEDYSIDDVAQSIVKQLNRIGNGIIYKDEGC